MIDIDGQHIKIRGKPLEWNIEIVDNPDTKHGNTFFLLHPATLEQVKKIAECGWLYFKIQNFINENNVLEKGLILQVLSSSLKDELIHYYKLISVIKEAVDKDSQKFLTDSTKERNKEIATDLPQNSTITDPLITVQRLWVMCTDMKHRLQFLMAIIMNCKGKKGCQILDVLKEFTFQGDIKGTGATANSLLDKCSQPLAECLCNWITKGKLVDRFREFPIDESMDLMKQDAWNQKYVINYTMLPKLISNDQIYKMFSAGKSLYFLKEVCKVKREKNNETPQENLLNKLYFQVDNFSDIPYHSSHISNLSPYFHHIFKSQVNDQNAFTRYNFLDTELGALSRPFINLLSHCYENNSRDLVNHVMSRLRLVSHIAAIRDHVMLARGDFTSQLVTGLESLQGVDRDANQGHDLKHTFFGHKMAQILEDAIKNSNSKYESSDILNRITVVASKPKKDNNKVPIWEMFCLKYVIEEGPLSVVLTKAHLHNYQALFLVIWRTKWLCHTLLKCWKRQKNYPNFLFKSRGRFNGSNKMDYLEQIYSKKIGSLFHSCHIMVATMSHFIQQIQYYFNFEVMECSWHTFIKELNGNSNDLDKIISCHGTYLNQLTRGFLLAPNFKLLYAHLLGLYDLVFQFLTLHASIHTLIALPLSAKGLAFHISQDRNNMKKVAIFSPIYSTDTVDNSSNNLINFTSTPFESMYPSKNDKKSCFFQTSSGYTQINKARNKTSNNATPLVTFIERVQLYRDKIHLLKISFQDLMKDFLFMLVDKPGISLSQSHSHHASLVDNKSEPPDNQDLSTCVINEDYMHLFYLSFRLDFNDFYKNRDVRLRSSLTFSKRLSHTKK
ncbi:unnamed protein product [Gordionus sp. m RMFG-2023]